MNNIDIIGELLVGFKFVGEEMNKLEAKGEMGNFILGTEESHGYIAGNYIREKDAAIAGLWLAEYAAELKKTGETLVDKLNQIYIKYGYYRNYLAEIRLPGAEGMSQIQKIQDSFRKSPPKSFGEFQVKNIEDWMDRKPILSKTDESGKQGLVFEFIPIKKTASIKITVRPSGTEPKIKMYYEIGSTPFKKEDLEEIKIYVENVLRNLEKAFMLQAYKIIDIHFPERGFLLFWQLPLQDKLKYFEIEPEIVTLTKIVNKQERKKLLMEKLSFLGSDPLIKINQAFKFKYKKTLEEYLKL